MFDYNFFWIKKFLVKKLFGLKEFWIKNSFLVQIKFNPTPEGVQILWVGGGGASGAPPNKSRMEWA